MWQKSCKLLKSSTVIDIYNFMKDCDGVVFSGAGQCRRQAKNTNNQQVSGPENRVKKTAPEKMHKTKII